MDPGNVAWQRELSVSLEKLALMEEEHGNRRGAIAAWKDALSISERLAEAYPENVDLKVTPVIHLAGVARTLDPANPASREQGLELLDRALAILRPLSEAGKLNANRQSWIDWIEQQRAALNRIGRAWGA